MRVELWTTFAPIPLLGKVYTLTGLVVKHWEVGELNALQNALVIDRFDLDYESMQVSIT